MCSCTHTSSYGSHRWRPPKFGRFCVRFFFVSFTHTHTNSAVLRRMHIFVGVFVLAFGFSVVDLAWRISAQDAEPPDALAYLDLFGALTSLSSSHSVCVCRYYRRGVFQLFGVGHIAKLRARGEGVLSTAAGHEFASGQ